MLTDYAELVRVSVFEAMETTAEDFLYFSEFLKEKNAQKTRELKRRRK